MNLLILQHLTRTHSSLSNHPKTICVCSCFSCCILSFCLSKKCIVNCTVCFDQIFVVFMSLSHSTATTKRVSLQVVFVSSNVHFYSRIKIKSRTTFCHGIIICFRLMRDSFRDRKKKSIWM